MSAIPLHLRRTLAALFVLAAAAGAQAAPPSGKPLLIVLPQEALPTGVGANGFVTAGTFYSGGGFHWMPTGGVVSIGGIEALDVSQDGKVLIGSALDPNRLKQAAVWTGGTSWRLLGSVGAQRPCDLLISSGLGTSDDGRVVVGLAWDGCSYARAFRWEESTGMVDLGTLGGSSESTRANGVSGDGRVVIGWEEHVSGFRQGAKWVDRREELIRPGALLGEAHAANRDGSIIVGSGCTPGAVGPPTAWTWTQAAGVTCKPVTPPAWALDVPYSAFMLGLSDDGRVIGGALSFGLDAESVVWFDGEPIPLRDYLRANGVPDAFEGWINTGFIQDVSRDGRTLVGYGAGPRAFQGFLVVLPELAKQ